MSEPQPVSDVFGDMFNPVSVGDYVLRSIVGVDHEGFIGLADSVRGSLSIASNVYWKKEVYEPCISYQGKLVEGTRLEVLVDCAVDVGDSALAVDFFHKTVWDVVDNARRFSLLKNPDDREGLEGYKAGKLLVDLRVDEDYVVCDVLDSGPGVSAKVITALRRKRDAMRDYRNAKTSDETTSLVKKFKPKEMGGLGLSAAMNYTEAIGGMFLLQNSRDRAYKGARVVMRWPVSVFNNFDENFMAALRRIQGIE